MEFSRCINYLLTTAQRSVFLAFSEGLEPYGITPAQYGVLNCIWLAGPQSPSDIANKLRLELPTVSGLLDRMQKKNLIVREINPQNHRNVTVSLTEQGALLEEPVCKSVENLNRMILDKLDPSDAAKLLEALQKLLGESW